MQSKVACQNSTAEFANGQQLHRTSAARKRERLVSFAALAGLNPMLTNDRKHRGGAAFVESRGSAMGLNRFGSTLAEVEREHIIETLNCCDGNRTRAAKLLDISVRCLRMKLHQFGQSDWQ